MLQATSNTASESAQIEALNRTDVCNICRISKATLDRLLRDSRFPRPVYLTPRTPRWSREAIREYLRSLGERAPEPTGAK